MWIEPIDSDRELDEFIENDIDFATEEKHKFDQIELFEGDFNE